MNCLRNETPVLLKMERDDRSTVGGACGHVCKGRDFHWLCRTCQLLTTNDLCCYKHGNLCALGKHKKNGDAAQFKQVMSRRMNYSNVVRNCGWLVKMVWLEQHAELRHSALGRIAYAVGAGATSLQD